MRRYSMTCAVVAFGLAIAALWQPCDALAAKRIAVIIGNGDYQKVPHLPNPPHDADDVAAAFERLGFTVHKLINARYDDMRRALLQLGREARNSEMAVLYFSGHGMEIGGQNWLIPIDAELRADTDAENEAISLSSVMLQVSTASKLGLVILDACRNNPFAAKMAFSTRTRAVARGLVRTEPNENVLVAYSAKDGTTANDGGGRNSPFTTALLKNIEQPGLEVTFLFRNVRDSVMAATRREQQPFVYGSLSSNAIYFKDPPPPDETLWATIRDIKGTSPFEEFLRRFPSSSHAPEARARLEEARKLALAVAPPTGPGIIRTPSQPSVDDDASPQAGGLFTAKDAELIAAIMGKHKMIVPQYRINRPDSAVPERFRKFVGVWASRIAFGGGRGRHAAVIVTDVDGEGLARGYYGYGPATPLSIPGPATTFVFAGKIEKNVLNVKFPNFELWISPTAGNAMMLRSHSKKWNRNAAIVLEPVWRLSERERAAKR